MTVENINVNDDIKLFNMNFYQKGYLTGYITGILKDKETNRNYDILYRIHDPNNGNDYTLVSVDYGWKLKDDNLIDLTEQKLTEIAKSLNLNFDELEQKKLEYSMQD